MKSHLTTKRILRFAGITTLLLNTGCLVTEGRGHGHGRHGGHSEVIVPAPVVVVPVVRVHH